MLNQVRLLKTNIYFLVAVAIVICVLAFFGLRYKYPENTGRNATIAIVVAIVFPLVIYYVPIKVPISNEPFEINGPEK